MSPEPETWTTLASATKSTARTTTDSQSTAWDLTTDRIRVRLRWSPNHGLHLAQLQPGNGAQLDGSPASSVFALAWSGPSSLGPLADAKLLDSSAVASDTHITLSIRLDLAPLTITVHIRCHDDLAVLQQWLDIETTEAGVLRNTVPFVLLGRCHSTSHPLHRRRRPAARRLAPRIRRLPHLPPRRAPPHFALLRRIRHPLHLGRNPLVRHRKPRHLRHISPFPLPQQGEGGPGGLGRPLRRPRILRPLAPRRLLR